MPDTGRKRLSVEITAFGERGWLARFRGFATDVESGIFANCVGEALRDFSGVTDAVAGVDSLALRYDPTELNADDARQILCNQIDQTDSRHLPSPRKRHTLPACYEGEYALDIDVICTRNNISKNELIERHTNKVYRVITLGFAPGFTYLGPLDEKLVAPRLPTPRARLAAGSIGIAGGFTGVYSLASPGGWNIIARTPEPLFNKDAEDPFFVRAGDEVSFYAISNQEFRAISKASL